MQTRTCIVIDLCFFLSIWLSLVLHFSAAYFPLCLYLSLSPSLSLLSFSLSISVSSPLSFLLTFFFFLSASFFSLVSSHFSLSLSLPFSASFSLSFPFLSLFPQKRLFNNDISLFCLWLSAHSFHHSYLKAGREGIHQGTQIISFTNIQDVNC